MPSKVCDDITCPFQNYKDCTSYNGWNNLSTMELKLFQLKGSHKNNATPEIN